MIISQLQRQFLRQGLLQLTTNQDRWRVVFSIILPNIIGCEIHQDRIAAYDHHMRQGNVRYTATVKVKQVSFNADQVTISANYQLVEEPKTGCYDRGSIEFKLFFADECPVLEDEKLILGAGNYNNYDGKWYILLK